MSQFQKWLLINRIRERKIVKKWILAHNKLNIPKIIRSGAHTSTSLFLSPLITQWYLNLLKDTQFWRCANSPQFILRAALSHSVFEVGQVVTIRILLTASGQNLFWLLINYCNKKKGLLVYILAQFFNQMI